MANNHLIKLAFVFITTAIVVWFAGKAIDAGQRHNSAVVTAVLEGR